MINKNFIVFTSSIIFASLISADMSDAKKLFIDAKCLECHETTSFKHREDKVNSFSKLKQKVKMCEYNSKTGWFDDEIIDVTNYLNKTYYHYKTLKK